MNNKFKVSRKDDNYANFSIRIRKSLVEKADQIALHTNRSRNQVINMCIDFAIENFEDEVKVAEDANVLDHPKEY